MAEQTPGIFVRFAELSYPEVERLLTGSERKVALLAVGSTEAHGPHLPLSTDSLIGEAVVERAAAELAARGHLAAALPPIHYAVTEWARDFAGSTSIDAEVAIGMVLGTCRAARATGFDRVVVFTAHLEPDHIASLREVARRYAEATGEALLFVDTTRRALAARLTPEFQSGSCHAGRYETSLVLAIRPDLVRMELAAALPEHVVPLAEHIRAGKRGFLECDMPRAYCGAPALATAEEGREILATLATLVVEAVVASFA
ncbi:creatininase family protein [Nannocystis pusilla]|uniref:Creatininase family protein n=1 Tax=Nannocystis pusilla TaxID=889268 RepID=A0ABS7U2R7_9BACT|nr:creatininase family protein [Nannocystis pusilla]MBZ5714729.1 creatininase family protein [Nannocystis pusilla]